MSRQHLEHLDRLVDLDRGLLETLERGEAPDLPTYDVEHEAAFAALRTLGDLAPDSEAVADCQRRLQELARLNARLRTHLATLRDDTRRRLVGMDQGRRGLRGYKRSVTASRRPGGTHGAG